MSFFLCKLWPYLAGGLIGWLLAGWLARRFKHAEPPVERIVEKVVEVDNPQHLSLIRKLEGENSQIAGLMSKVSQFESRKPEVVEKRVEVDNPKHLALISKLEKENAEISVLRSKLSGFESQEVVLRKLKEENSQISALKYNIKNFESKAAKEGDELADLHSKATRYRAQIEKLESENKHLHGLQEKLNDLENDEPKQLALISRLEKENKELADLKAQQAKFEAQEEKILSLESDSAKLKSLQDDIARYKNDNTQQLSLISKLENENKELDALKEQLSELDAQKNKLAQLEVENKKIANLESSLNRFENDNTQHLSLIGKLEQEKKHIGNKVTDLEGELLLLKRGQKLDIASAKAAGIIVKDENDLTVIEGIGPKIAELLKANGVNNLKELSEVDTGKIQGILNKGGSQFQMANPGTWPDQATLACNNRWPALKSLQNVLDGGVYPDSSAKSNASKGSGLAPKLDLASAKAAGIAVTKEGDFTAIEGIGPKISELIYADGIKTFKELSEVSPSRLQTILDNAGPQYKMANPGTWPDQAHLASHNRWPALKALQDILDGGVYPDDTKAKMSSTNDSAKVQKLESELKKYRDNEKAAVTAGSIVDVDKAKAAGFTMRRKGDQDDFTVIEGIGPKINELIHAEGIHTYSELAATKVNSIQAILDKAGPSFTLADPETWSAQSDLAAKNEWEKLMKWQDELDGGKS